ncbi:MAG: hypothetical protein AAB415_02215, partial [Patescibacteria group bacterium]
GLNGGYTVVESWPNGLRNLFRDWGHLAIVTAQIISPTNNASFQKGQRIHWRVNYQIPALVTHWIEDLSLDTTHTDLGPNTLQAGYGAGASVVVGITGSEIGTPGAGGNNTSTIDQLVNQYMTAAGFPPGVLKAMIRIESSNDFYSTRYEPCEDIGYKEDGLYNSTSTPYSYWVIGGGGMATGTGAMDFARNNPQHYSPKKMIEEYSLSSFKMSATTTPTVYDVWNDNKNFYWYCHAVTKENGNYPAQFLIATSYGPAQMLYRSAILEGFNQNLDTDDPFDPPRNPWELFYPSVNLQYAVDHLKGKYQIATSEGRGYVSNDCKVKPHDNQYFINTYGDDWVEALKLDYRNNTPRWQSITQLLDDNKDRLWWAVRFYNGRAPSTIQHTNKVCGVYHEQNPQQ